MINKKYSNLGFLSYLISGSTSDTKVACKVPNCKERTDLKEMRTHVGEHILRGHVAGPNVCGFCGLSTCKNTLVQTSKGVKSISGWSPPVPTATALEKIQRSCPGVLCAQTML